jgi:hypothetical protein
LQPQTFDFLKRAAQMLSRKRVAQRRTEKKRLVIKNGVKTPYALSDLFDFIQEIAVFILLFLATHRLLCDLGSLITIAS